MLPDLIKFDVVISARPTRYPQNAVTCPEIRSENLKLRRKNRKVVTATSPPRAALLNEFINQRQNTLNYSPRTPTTSPSPIHVRAEASSEVRDVGRPELRLRMRFAVEITSPAIASREGVASSKGTHVRARQL